MSKGQSIKKSSLHPNNLHQGRYDLLQLIQANQALKLYVAKNIYGDLSIDFANPKAVKELNKALLTHYYQINHWDIPEGYLCPPIPGRADYLHFLQDLLTASNQGKKVNGNSISVLDIGTGANCIYPLLGNSLFGWRFTGSDIDQKAISVATAIKNSNSQFGKSIELKLQPQVQHIFKGIIAEKEFFDLTLCNPPFHESKEAATEGSRRKIKNLTGKQEKEVKLNFGGQSNELWCEGGELGFIRKMIRESREYKYQVYWFTCLVSKKENLKPIYNALRDAAVVDFKTINMAQGNKQSRFVAWTFLTSTQQDNWRKTRWE